MTVEFKLLRPGPGVIFTIITSVKVKETCLLQSSLYTTTSLRRYKHSGNSGIGDQAQ